MRKTLSPTTGALVVLVAALSGCSGSGEGSGPSEPPLVRAFVVASGSEIQARYTGTVRARIESNLGFRVPGQITQRLVNEGDTVRRGQPLMRIDPSDFELLVSATSNRLRAAEAEAARAAADAERLEGLVEAGAVSQATYDTAVAARDASAASVRALRAERGETRNQQGYTVLRADASGVITTVMAEPGQVVAAGAPVMTLARSGEREAVVSIPETLVRDLPKSATATPYGSNASSSAVLREVSGAADPLTRTYTARYTLRGDAAQAPIGSTVSLELGIAEAPNKLSVPLGAIHQIDGKTGVWVIGKDNKLEFVEVDVTRFGDELAYVSSSGLKRGARVVALGAERLRADQAVRILKERG